MDVAQEARPVVKRAEWVSVQYMRGMAALLVVIAHALEHPLAGKDPALTLVGRFGVALFFCISGFIITVICGRGGFSALEFAKRRVERVVPLYWLVTFLAAAACLIAPSVFKTTTFTLAHFFESLFFIPHEDPSNPGSWAPLYKLGWTLNYELFFYVAVAVLGSKLDYLKRAGAVVALMSALVLAGLIFPTTGVLKFYESSIILNFIGGVILGALALSGRLSTRSAPGFVISGGILAFVVWMVASGQPVISTVWINPMIAFASIALAAAMLAIELSNRLPPVKALRMLGDASYSMYLTHMFVVGPAWLIAKKLHLGGVLASIGAIGVSLVVGLISYRFVEKPLMAYFHNRRKTAVAKTAAASPAA